MLDGSGGGPPGGDRPPERGYAERLKDKAQQLARRLRGVRIAPEAKGDEKAALDDLRNMAMLYHGPVRGADRAGVGGRDGRDGGIDGKEADAVPGVVAPALSRAQLAQGFGVLGEMPRADAGPGHETMAAPLPVELPPTSPPPMNGSIPLRFERVVPPGDGPPAPVPWGTPIFGIALDARIGPQPVGVPVYAVPVDWLDGLDRLAATAHVAANEVTGTYRREGILYTASGRARLYLAPPTNLTLREPPREPRRDPLD